MEMLELDSHLRSVKNHTLFKNKHIQVLRSLVCVCGSSSFHVGSSTQFIHIKCTSCGHETCL